MSTVYNNDASSIILNRFTQINGIRIKFPEKNTRITLSKRQKGKMEGETQMNDISYSLSIAIYDVLNQSLAILDLTEF